jgi:hypothetical protein
MAITLPKSLGLGPAGQVDGKRGFTKQGLEVPRSSAEVFGVEISARAEISALQEWGVRQSFGCRRNHIFWRNRFQPQSGRAPASLPIPDRRSQATNWLAWFELAMIIFGRQNPFDLCHIPV